MIRLRLVAALPLVCACSLVVRGATPAWNGRSEPDCRNLGIAVDYVMGLGFLLGGLLGVADRRPGTAYPGFAAMVVGALHGIAVADSFEHSAACEAAKQQWLADNSIREREPTAADASASPPPTTLLGGRSSRPWASGVPQAERDAALALLEAGNAALLRADYAAALETLQRGLAHWDHPAIRFNMAVCLINLDRPLEARDNLERSLVYGPQALDAELYARGLTYRALLDAQVSALTIDCPEPGEDVLLDGELVFTGPGVLHKFVAPGEHQLAATKRGTLPAARHIVLAPGQRVYYEIRPIVDSGSSR
jgi:hypothetical protein